MNIRSYDPYGSTGNRGLGTGDNNAGGIAARKGMGAEITHTGDGGF